MIRSPLRFVLPLAALCVAAPAAAQAPAQAAARTPTTLTGIRSWSSPTNTRIVLDFTARVTYVAPDSGRSRALTVTVPGEAMAQASSVPATLGVGDGIVDSVRVATGSTGARFDFSFHDSTAFRVFTLPVEPDKPYRVVVDVTRPGGIAAEDQRLAGIAASKRRDRVRLVAVDAGHGGDDVGARGPNGVLEKNVTLGVAKALVAELNQTPGIKAVLTRDSDYFIPLKERYRIAERMKADLFISIHANSSRRRGYGSGTEVYFLSLRGASDQSTQDLADLENAADHVGGVPAQAEDALVNILYDVKRTSALQQSQLLAETVLNHLTTDRRLEQRGVKQAGFAVLKSVEFPSVLIETAFINNPTEARMLRSAEFQRKLGGMIARGVQAFFDRAGIGYAPETGPTSIQNEDGTR
jgi:N-acetylmuramoyl-L-alanine amidase